jgi:hypothetical protein
MVERASLFAMGSSEQMIYLVNAQELRADFVQNVEHAAFQGTNLIVTRVGGAQEFQ